MPPKPTRHAADWLTPGEALELLPEDKKISDDEDAWRALYALGDTAIPAANGTTAADLKRVADDAELTAMFGGEESAAAQHSIHSPVETTYARLKSRTAAGDDGAVPRLQYVTSLAEFETNLAALGIPVELFAGLPVVLAGGAVLAAMHRLPGVKMPAELRAAFEILRAQDVFASRKYHACTCVPHNAPPIDDYAGPYQAQGPVKKSKKDKKASAAKCPAGGTLGCSVEAARRLKTSPDLTTSLALLLRHAVEGAHYVDGLYDALKEYCTKDAAPASVPHDSKQPRTKAGHYHTSLLEKKAFINNSAWPNMRAVEAFVVRVASLPPNAGALAVASELKNYRTGVLMTRPLLHFVGEEDVEKAARDAANAQEQTGVAKPADDAERPGGASADGARFGEQPYIPIRAGWNSDAARVYAKVSEDLEILLYGGEIPVVLRRALTERLGDARLATICTAFLQPAPLEIARSFFAFGRGNREMMRSFAKTDVDLFVVGLKTDAEVFAVVREILRRHSAVAGARTQFKITQHAVAINDQCSPAPPIQVILRRYESVHQVLVGFDLDCCALAYDCGEKTPARVLATPRGVRALRTHVNLVSETRQSLTYEMRLLKYARRGFAVALPRGVNYARLFADARRIHEAASLDDHKAATGLLRLAVALTSADNEFGSAYAKNDTLLKRNRSLWGVHDASSDYAGHAVRYPETFYPSHRTVFGVPTKNADALDFSKIKVQSVLPHVQGRIDADKRRLMTGSFHPSATKWYGKYAAKANKYPPASMKYPLDLIPSLGDRFGYEYGGAPPLQTALRPGVVYALPPPQQKEKDPPAAAQRAALAAVAQLIVRPDITSAPTLMAEIRAELARHGCGGAAKK